MNKRRKVSVLLLILAFFFPLLGYALYWVKKREQKSVAKDYLVSGIVGTVLVGALILSMC